MNAERKETVDAVADELLHICDISAPEGYMSLIEVRDFANRFKAAAKEVEGENATLHKVAVGLQRSREALEAMVAFWDIHGGAYSVRVCPVRDNPEEVEAERVSVMARGKAALAAPPRNCDVGTPLEQAERFNAFCLPRVGKCCEASSCPAKHKINQIGIQYCQLVWAQLPYVAPATPEKGGEE